MFYHVRHRKLLSQDINIYLLLYQIRTERFKKVNGSIYACINGQGGDAKNSLIFCFYFGLNLK